MRRTSEHHHRLHPRLLKRELPRYPYHGDRHLSDVQRGLLPAVLRRRGGAGKIEVPAVKTIGYGWPLFPELDAMLPEEAEPRTVGRPCCDSWSWLRDHEERRITTAWPQEAPPLKDGEFRDAEDAEDVEDLDDTTRKLLACGFRTRSRPASGRPKWPRRSDSSWSAGEGLDRAGIYGDILAFLPTTKTIDEACDIIRAGVGDRVDVYA